MTNPKTGPTPQVDALPGVTPLGLRPAAATKSTPRWLDKLVVIGVSKKRAEAIKQAILSDIER